MNHRDNTTYTKSILYIARRGLALAALLIFATTAAATWLASDRAEASPAGKSAVVARAAADTAPVPSAAEDGDDDGKLTKEGKVLTGKLNLNTATEEELQMLPGIGPKKAQRIIEYRTKHGKFERVRDLRRVKGFGYKTVNKLSPYLATEGKSTLQAN